MTVVPLNTLCVCHYCWVPGEIKSREVVLDPQPRRDQEQRGGAGLRKLNFSCFELFLNSSATDIVFVSAPARQLKQQLRGAQVAGQWRGDTALTLPLFWRRSTVSPVFFGRYPRSSLHIFVPPSPDPPPHTHTHTHLSLPVLSHLASVDVKQFGQGHSSFFVHLKLKTEVINYISCNQR